MNETIRNNTQGIPISLNLACRILHRGKEKVKKLIGTRIRRLDSDNNSFSLDLADVLELIGKNY